MPNIITVPLATTLSLIQTQLVTATGLASNLIFFRVGDMNPPQFQNDQDIVIYLGDPTPVEQEQEGAGRWFQVLKRPLTIQLRSRAWVDLSDRDSNFLLQTTNHLTFEDTVVNALSEFYPTDSNGNLTTVEALHFSPSSKPMKPNKTQIDWYQSLMVFELVYQSNITQSS